MNNTPLKAIKQFCYECCGKTARKLRGVHHPAVRSNRSDWEKNPYINRKSLSEEQKELAKQRFTDARNRRKAEEVSRNE